MTAEGQEETLRSRSPRGHVISAESLLLKEGLRAFTRAFRDSVRKVKPPLHLQWLEGVSALKRIPARGPCAQTRHLKTRPPRRTAQSAPGSNNIFLPKKHLLGLFLCLRNWKQN